MNIEAIRSEYRQGTRVILVYMDDPNSPPAGTIGTVWNVDDMGNILVAWDNGPCMVVLDKTDMIVKKEAM